MLAWQRERQADRQIGRQAPRPWRETQGLALCSFCRFNGLWILRGCPQVQQ